LLGLGFGPLVRRPSLFVLLSIAWVSISGIAPNSAIADTAVWLGGTGVWNDATQWSSNPVYPPTPPYSAAEIDSGTVDLNTSVSLSNLTVTGGTIVRSAGTFVLTTGSGGLFRWSGGTLTGVPMNIRGGMAIEGQVHLGGGQTLRLFAPSSVPNTGIATQEGGDLLFNPGGGTLRIDSGSSGSAPDASYSLLDDSGMFSNGGTGTLDIRGTFQKIGGSGVSVIEATLLRTFGDNVTVASGTLRFAGDVRAVYSANQLREGPWNVLNGSTLEFSQASAAGGAVIATNGGRILLSGASAKIADASGNDILRGYLTLNTNTLTIQDGADFHAAAGFRNSGNITIGANSTFSTSGTDDYLNLATTTLASDASTLAVAPGHAVSNTGTFRGIGTIQGNLTNSGIIQPGLSGQPGVLTIEGNFAEGSSSTFTILLGGPNGEPVSTQLSVLGTSLLDGILDISILTGFTPSLHDQFTILTSAAGLSGTFSGVVHAPGFDFDVLYQPDRVILDVTTVPEPGTLLLVSSGLVCIALARRRPTPS
jgi:hypothetical protein